VDTGADLEHICLDSNQSFGLLDSCLEGISFDCHYSVGLLDMYDMKDPVDSWYNQLYTTGLLGFCRNQLYMMGHLYVLCSPLVVVV
jgi:hypothetical protein